MKKIFWPPHFLLALVVLAMASLVFARPSRLEKKIPYSGELLVTVSMDIGLGQVNVVPMEDEKHILKAVVEYTSEEYRPLIEYSKIGSKGRLRLRSKREERPSIFGFRGKGTDGSVKNEWDLSFSAVVPYRFDINLGLGAGDFDFTGLKIRDFEVSVGLSDVKVRFGERNKEELESFEVSTGLGNLTVYDLLNSNPEEFKVDCGMGSAVVYLQGDITRDVTGYLAVGLGSMTVKVSKEFGVELRTEKSFLSSIGLDGFEEYDYGVYRSSNWEKARYKITLFIEVGLGSINIVWVD